MKKTYLQLSEYDLSKRPLAIATVIRTQGSTPQKPGSSAVFSGDGLLAGTVGGGVTEGRVQEAAIGAIKNGSSLIVTFDLYNDIGNKEEAICGGRITVLIDARPVNSRQVFEKMKESLLKREAGVLATMVTEDKGSSVMINRYWITGNEIPSIQPEFLKHIMPAVHRQIESQDSYNFREMRLSSGDQEPSSVFLLEPVFPPDRLIVAGAGHIGRALCHLGSLLDFEVTVIDDRPEYANRNYLPDADNIVVQNIGEALQNMSKTAGTYVVIVTRGHKDDADALRPCIGTGLSYLGMIGSRTKVATMRESFLAEGLATKDQWERIFTPIGLEIGSETVEEIAVSIAAQLVKVRNSHRQVSRH